MSEVILEGWFSDPYARHEARWLSEGKATKLVRDGTATAYDDPPAGPWLKDPEPLEAEAGDGTDQRRADEAEAGEGYSASRARWAIYDQLAAQPPSAFDDVSRRWPPE